MAISTAASAGSSASSARFQHASSSTSAASSSLACGNSHSGSSSQGLGREALHPPAPSGTTHSPARRTSGRHQDAPCPSTSGGSSSSSRSSRAPKSAGTQQDSMAVQHSIDQGASSGATHTPRPYPTASSSSTPAAAGSSDRGGDDGSMTSVKATEMQTPGSRIDSSIKQQRQQPLPLPSQRNGPPHMDLVTYPTQDLIVLVASLLQRIAAANDKLRRDRCTTTTSNGARDDDEPKLTGLSTQRSSPGRPRSSCGGKSDVAADMVIPPFKPKPSTPHQVDHVSSEPTASQTQTPQTPSPRRRRRSESHGLITNDEDISMSPETTSRSLHPDTVSNEIDTAIPGSPPLPPLSPPAKELKWPTTTAAEHAVSHPSSLLCFHARNVPSIGIETYLQRILKYCPVTNDVFISLLVYFDRMSRKLASPEDDMVAAAAAAAASSSSSSAKSSSAQQHPPSHPPSSSSDDRNNNATTTHSEQQQKGFAIDSYNVHRLVIAGITISSKFHSDVFYTNSRYAKVSQPPSVSCFCFGFIRKHAQNRAFDHIQVGGLPQTELNQLELQFLLLNDFDLMIPLDEMQQYANRLLAYGQEE